MISVSKLSPDTRPIPPAVAGAKTNAKTRDGWNSPSGYTPLHIAAERGHLAVVMLLVASGAKVSARNGSSKSALDLAIESDHAVVARYLKLASKPSLKKP